MITHDVVDHMASWHGALTLDSEDRQSQPVPDGGDELDPPEVKTERLAWQGVEPVSRSFSRHTVKSGQLSWYCRCLEQAAVGLFIHQS